MRGKTSLVLASAVVAISASLRAACHGVAKAAASETVIYDFGASSTDGFNPAADLIADAAGTLYGVTQNGGTTHENCGTVFTLAPPAAGQTAWAESVIFDLPGGTHGCRPNSTLVASGGALFGATMNNGFQNRYYTGEGVVFELSPPRGVRTIWKQTVLYRFPGMAVPVVYSTLSAGALGVLYGTFAPIGNGQFGIIFRLTPPAAGQTAWTFEMLHAFTGGADGFFPRGTLLVDPSGVLYGTTEDGGANFQGTLFALTPPAAGQTQWTETVLHDFGDTQTRKNGAQLPSGRLLRDASGAFYGTSIQGGHGTSCSGGCGTVFKLSPPAPGQTEWRETLLHSFDLSAGDGIYPAAGVVAGPGGALYGTTAGVNQTGGTVFKLAPPSAGSAIWTETILHVFAGGFADGCTPAFGLYADALRRLYGLTGDEDGDNGCGAHTGGTAYQITP